MTRIILTLNDAVLQEVMLLKPRTTIGRRSDSDIVLDNPAVSAEHAVIFTMGGDTFLEDQNSKNGTQINGEPVKKHMLQDGDVITVAHFKMRYVAHVSDLSDQNALPASQWSNDRTGMDKKDVVACVKMLNGENVGKEIALTKLITTIGRPGIHVAVITRKGGGYFLTHVKGNSQPMVNGEAISSEARKLVHGDVIDISGAQLSLIERPGR